MHSRHPLPHAAPSALLIALAVSLGAAVSLGSGCAKADFIELKPTRVDLSVRGESRKISARAMSRQGRYYPEIEFSWRSADEAVATVDQAGVIKAVGSGRTEVFATAGALEAKLAVSVTLVEEIKVPAEALTLSLEENKRAEPEIVALGPKGDRLEGRVATFKALTPKIINIDRGGGIWPLAEGETVVEVQIEGLIARFDVRVTR